MFISQTHETYFHTLWRHKASRKQALWAQLIKKYILCHIKCKYNNQQLLRKNEDRLRKILCLQVILKMI